MVGRNMHMDTYFAPAERSSSEELQKDVEVASQNPVISGVMQMVSGLLAILNEHRQILTINAALLDMLGIEDAGEALGLRPGEAIQCIHAHDMPGGCGTSKFCPTCGMAVAIVASLESGQPEHRICVATVERDGECADLYLQVHASPITSEGQRFTLLFLQDITAHQQRAALERVFFHDITNLIQALRMTTHLLDVGGAHNAGQLTERVKQITQRLAKEVEIQKTLADADADGYHLSLQDVAVGQIIQDLAQVFAGHPAAKGKTLRLPKPIPQVWLYTDMSLLLRLLTNMLLNAFEATEEGGEVKLWLEQSQDALTFCVWNQRAIPHDIALRVFQRNFSTKKEAGRGLGTYAMKLFGEDYLGGRVGFTTSALEGTMFRLWLPRNTSLDGVA